MLLLIEGIDLAGKSFISKQLLAALPHCFYIKHGNRPKNSSTEEKTYIKVTYEDMLTAWKAIAKPGNNMIFDRFFPSELVYSEVKRGYNAFEDHWYRTFEESLIFQVRNPIVLYVYTSVAEILERMKIRGEDYMEPEDVEKLIKRYDHFIANTKLPVYSVKSGTPVQHILETLNEIVSSNEEARKSK